MKDSSRTKQELIEELSILKQRIQELEHSESKRKGVEEALIKSEAKLREEQNFNSLLLNTSPALIVAIGLDGKTLMMNKALLDTLEYTAEEIKETDYLTMFVPEEDREILAGVFQKIIQEGIATVNENRIISKSGRKYVVEWHGGIVKNEAGGVGFFVGVGINISTRKRAEDALMQNEARYRSLFDSAHDAIILMDRNIIIDCNQRTVELFRCPKEKIVGKKTANFWPERQADGRLTSEMAVEHIEKALRDERSSNEVTHLRADGTLVDTDVTLNVFEINSKKYLQATIRDITERKQAEEALREQDIQLKKLTSSVPGMIYQFTKRPDGTYYVPFTTEAINDIFGCSPQDVCEDFSPMARVISPEDFDKVVGSIEYSAQHLTTWTCEYRVQIPGQSIRWILGKSTPEKLADGSITWHGFNTDITVRKRMEDLLRKSEEQYRTLVENASDIIFRLDDTGHMTFVNPAAISVIGYKEKELIGKYYATLIRPEMQEEAIKFFGRQFVKKIENTYTEYPVVRKDGREIWLGQNTQLIFQDGKVVAFQAMARDLTERKKMEALLKDSENRYRELSIVDELTQLFNSRYFYFQLKIELDRSNRYELPLTLLLLDLDNFKVFNDTYGHVEGDQVLRRLGQVVKKCLRQTDSAYRYGGEEFTILMPMTTSKNGAVTAERIRTELKKETFSPAPGQDVHLTVSIGLAQYKPQEDMKAFVHRVDQLMYQVKKDGKNRVCSES